MPVIYMPKDLRYSGIGQSIQTGMLQGMQIGMQKDEMERKKAAGALTTLMEMGGTLTLEQARGIEKDLGYEEGFINSITDPTYRPTKDMAPRSEHVASGDSYKPTGVRMKGRSERDLESAEAKTRQTARLTEEFFPEALDRSRKTTEAEQDIKQEYTIEKEKRRAITDKEQTATNARIAKELQTQKDKASLERTKIAATDKGAPTQMQLMNFDRQTRKDAIALVKPMVQKDGKLIEFDQDSKSYASAIAILKANGIDYDLAPVSALMPWNQDVVNIIIKAGASTTVKKVPTKSEITTTGAITVKSVGDDGKVTMSDGSVKQGKWNADKSIITLGGKGYQVK